MERSRSPGAAPAYRDRSRSPANAGAKRFPDDSQGFKLYIGNLSFDTAEADLRDAFGKYGTVTDCFCPTDRETGKPRGFGFVTFADERDAKDAVEKLNDSDLMGRQIRVNPANPKGSAPPRSSGGFGGGGGGGFGGGRGGGGRSDACFDFAKGTCSRGSSCRFSHDSSASSSRGGGGRESSYGGRDSYGSSRDSGRDSGSSRYSSRDSGYGGRDSGYGGSGKDSYSSGGRDSSYGGRDSGYGGGHSGRDSGYGRE